MARVPPSSRSSTAVISPTPCFGWTALSPSLNCILAAGAAARTAAVGRTVGGGGAFGTATAATFGRPAGGVETGRGRAGAAEGRVERVAALATFLADFTGV